MNNNQNNTTKLPTWALVLMILQVTLPLLVLVAVFLFTFLSLNIIKGTVSKVDEANVRMYAQFLETEYREELYMSDYVYWVDKYDNEIDFDLAPYDYTYDVECEEGYFDENSEFVVFNKRNGDSNDYGIVFSPKTRVMHIVMDRCQY